MAERVRFYTDEHVPRAVVEGLRRRGVDVLTVAEADMPGHVMKSTWRLHAAKGVCFSHRTQISCASMHTVCSMLVLSMRINRASQQVRSFMA